MGMKLIDYDILRTLFNDKYKETKQLILNGETHLDNLAEGFLEADRVVCALPTVDAVEVVRCKDCKHLVLTAQGEHNPADCVCNYWMTDGLEDNYFCSKGERR